MNIQEIKSVARASLKGNWGTAILVIFLVSAISGVSAAAAGVGPIIVAGPLAVGSASVFVSILRGEAVFEKMFDGFKNCFVNAFVAGLLSSLFTALWSLLFVIPGIVKGYGYAMYPYLLQEFPEMSGREALRISQKLMNGYKWQLFCLQLSYIFWMLLSALTFGILALYVVPWMTASTAEFYKQLRIAHPIPELGGVKAPEYSA